MKVLEVFIRTIFIQIKSSWSRPMFRFTLMVNPILTTIIVCEMFINSRVENFSVYIILGSGLMSLWTNICFSSIGDINRERWIGTLPFLYVSRVNFNLIVVAKMIGNIILSLFSIIITILCAYLVYGITISVSTPMWLGVAIILTIISFSILSMLVSYVMLLTRKTPLYMNLIDTPIIILSGFVFPVEILPQSVQVISYILLPTWAVKLITEILTNGFNTNALNYMSVLILLAILYLLITYCLWRIVNRKIKKTASLEVF